MDLAKGAGASAAAMVEVPDLQVTLVQAGYDAPALPAPGQGEPLFIHDLVHFPTPPWRADNHDRSGSPFFAAASFAGAERPRTTGERARPDAG
jgi:hypothetical protein